MIESSRSVCRVFCLLVLVCTVLSCELDQTHNGCRIDNGSCSCSFGCKSDFRYSTRKECEDALRGTSNNICHAHRCQNGGSCIQISQMPGYKCRCEGTGFWGSRCQRQCPTPADLANVSVPFECIII